MFLLGTLAGPAAHAEAPLLSTDLYLQDFPVVLTASRLAQPISEAPSAMTVIDREMIKASGFRTVPDLMRLVPGMYVGFADANRAVVSPHGVTDEFSRRMQVLIDGRSVYLPPFSRVNWADLPLQIQDIERIEVVRGPASASHGTNAFYGVINIITREAAAQLGSGISLTTGQASDASAFHAKAGETFDYRVSAGYRSDQGYDNTVLNDHNRTRLFNFRGNYHPNMTDSLDVQAGASQGEYGLGIVGRPEDAFRDTRARNHFLQASWLHVGDHGGETRLTYSYTDRRAVDPHLCIDTDTCEGKNLPGTPIADGYTRQEVYSQRNDLELQDSRLFGDDNRLVWGIGLRRDHAEYPLYLGRPYTIDSWRVFAHDEWHLTPAAILNVGTMFEDNGMGNRNNSPRASLNYHLSPLHTLRVGIATATRSPAMAEVYMDAQNTILGGAYVPPSTPLKPERIVSREVGYLGEFPTVGLSLDLRAYVDQVRDMIYVDKYPQLTAADSFKNLFEAEYQGVEAMLKYHWNERRSFIAAQYAYQTASIAFSSYPTQYFSTVIDPIDPATYPTVGHRVRHFYQTEVLAQYPQIVPRHSASLLLSHRFSPAWHFSGGYYWRGPVRVTNVSPDVKREETLHRLDLRLGRRFKFEQGHTAEVAVVIQNALQGTYPKYGVVNEAANVPFSRRAWLTVNFGF